jgi:hypothetical protein
MGNALNLLELRGHMYMSGVSYAGVLVVSYADLLTP